MATPIKLQIAQSYQPSRFPGSTQTLPSGWTSDWLLNNTAWRNTAPTPTAPAPAPAPVAPPTPTAPAPAPAPVAPPPPMSFEEYLRTHPGAGDAWAYLQFLLNDYGLGQLFDFAKAQIIEGRSQNEVVQRLREQDVYKKRFAVIEQRKQMGLPAMSEAEIISYERTATQLFRSAGLPQGFWDEPDDFVRLQVADISLAELESRINEGYLAASQAPTEVKAELESIYGISTGDLAAYYLDPDRTQAILTRQLAAAQRSADASRAGYGSLQREEAERLASLGITGQQAEQGFGALAQQRELFGALPGEGTDNISRGEQLSAAFESNAMAQKRIEERARKRKAVFEAGGGFATDRTGYAGLGTAR